MASRFQLSALGVIVAVCGYYFGPSIFAMKVKQADAQMRDDRLQQTAARKSNARKEAPEKTSTRNQAANSPDKVTEKQSDSGHYDADETKDKSSATMAPTQSGEIPSRGSSHLHPVGQHTSTDFIDKTASGIEVMSSVECNTKRQVLKWIQGTKVECNVTAAALQKLMKHGIILDLAASSINMRLESLPADFVKLTSGMTELKALKLTGNKLTELPAELKKLTKLDILYLDNNTLTSLPADIVELTELKTLVLGGNKLTELPADFGKLRNLNYLDLRRNELTSVPAADFGKLTNLKELDLTDNPNLKVAPDLKDKLRWMSRKNSYDTGAAKWIA